MTNKSVKFETIKPFLSSFSHWHVKGFSSKRDSTESRCVIGPENVLSAGHVRAAFCPEILQAGAVKGLTRTDIVLLLLAGQLKLSRFGLWTSRSTSLSSALSL